LKRRRFAHLNFLRGELLNRQLWTLHAFELWIAGLTDPIPFAKWLGATVVVD
jgi:hypothetical protein